MNKTENSRQLSTLFVRFLMSGGVNTAITYALYLTLIQFLSYKVSYTISFVAGILLAYCLSRFFVFRVKAGLSAVTLFPLIYLVQYLLGLGVVTLWVDTMSWNKALAPLASIALTVPITFFLSHLVFSQSSVPKEKVNEGYAKGAKELSNRQILAALSIFLVVGILSYLLPISDLIQRYKEIIFEYDFNAFKQTVGQIFKQYIENSPLE